MKILMLCIEFPPVNTTGNYRSAGFARYFSQNNVETIVLTCDVESGENTFGKRSDMALLRGLEKVKIYRFPIRPLESFWRKGRANSLRIWWNITDKIDKRWYYGDNKRKIDGIIRHECPDILYVSLPPFSMARTAMKLSKKFSVPLVTDMRDAWSLWVTSPFSTRFHYYKLLNLERRLFKHSSLVIGVTPELVKDFINQHPKLLKIKFRTIYNAYDNFKFQLKETKRLDDTIYRIGYVGSFYYNPSSEKIKEIKWYNRNVLKMWYYSPRKEQWIYRSPYFFLKTLALLLETNKELKSKIFFEYIGNTPTWLIKMVADMSLQNNFINHGFKSKQEVLDIQSGWNSILTTSEKVVNGEHFCLPSKLFDGITSRKKILAFTTPGSQTNFLKEYSQVSFFDPDDIAGNAKKLLTVLKFKNEDLNSNSLSNEFKRESQAKKLISHLYEKFNKKNNFVS